MQGKIEITNGSGQKPEIVEGEEVADKVIRLLYFAGAGCKVTLLVRRNFFKKII